MWYQLNACIRRRFSSAVVSAIVEPRDRATGRVVGKLAGLIVWGRASTSAEVTIVSGAQGTFAGARVPSVPVTQSL